MKKDFVTSLEQEVTRLEDEIAQLRRRQDNIKKLRGLYTGDSRTGSEELAEAQHVPLAISPAEMVKRVIENAGRQLSPAEIEEHIKQDYGMLPVGLEMAIAQELFGARRRPSGEQA
jgi:hypothetical protein